MKSAIRPRAHGRRSIGFTLIELLVVIAIIALLMAIILPALQEVKRRAMGIYCQANLQNLSLAWTMYAQSNDGRIVSGEVWANYNNVRPFDWVHPVISTSDPDYIPGMSDHERETRLPADHLRGGAERIFQSDVVDRVRAASNVWDLAGGQILLPDVVGFCRGVERALEMLHEAVVRCAAEDRGVFLLGEIIHNPWVNEYFRRQGVRQLTRQQGAEPERYIHAGDCAVIPAFGVSLPVRRALEAIGCEIVDTSCGDVRGLWRWGERAVAGGYGVLIFGRARHDETVVTKSRLAAAGGQYVVVGNLDQTRAFCRFVTGLSPREDFAAAFGPEATNASTPAPFERLAQVSQTTMLYDETMAVREILQEAFARRFGDEADQRLLLQAVELTVYGVDVIVVKVKAALIHRCAPKHRIEA